MSNILETKNLNFSYTKQSEEQENLKSIQVLKNINLEIKKSSFVAILGHNGCGKSTLAKHFNAVLLPESGAVFVDKIDTTNDEMLFQIRQTVGMVFQNPDNQIVATIVEEDVAFAPENLGVAPQEIRQRVDDALKSVDMYEMRHRAPSQLSGGQKQRVAIAGIIAMRPNCIVLDEPTAMLDPKGRKEVIKTIKMLNEKYGITIVLITHFMNEAAQADRVIVMDNGQIILDGLPQQVFENVETLQQVGLDVPQGTELIYRLNKLGFKNLENNILTPEQATQAILKAFS